LSCNTHTLWQGDRSEYSISETARLVGCSQRWFVNAQ